MKLFKPKNDIFLNMTASCTGPLEAKGPLGDLFDFTFDDSLLEEESYEKAESQMAKIAFETLLKKSKLSDNDIDVIFGGDLMNQCTSTSHALKDKPSSYVGLYGACSTFVLGAINASLAIEASWAKKAVFLSGSHFATAERQFRTPLEYGGQRPPTSQVTVTGYCASLLSTDIGPIRIEDCLVGRIVDSGLNDITDMGAVMAPAAADTIENYFTLTKKTASDFDLIVTGDLGLRGSELMNDILLNNNIKLKNHKDCGLMIYDPDTQDVHCGGSGCGCSACVFGAKLYSMLEKKEIKNMLLLGTGALMSPLTVYQKESIAGICHLVHFKGEEKWNI